MTDSTIAVLDIDGTLIDSNYQHALAWYRAFRQHGVTLALANKESFVAAGEELNVTQAAISRLVRLLEELFGDRNSVLRLGGVTVVAVDSTEPDLDHGQIGRGRYAWIEESFAASTFALAALAAAAFALVAGVNYLSARHWVRGDWTKTRLYSLSETTRKVVAALPQPWSGASISP